MIVSHLKNLISDVPKWYIIMFMLGAVFLLKDSISPKTPDCFSMLIQLKPKHNYVFVFSCSKLWSQLPVLTFTCCLQGVFRRNLAMLLQCPCKLLTSPTTAAYSSASADSLQKFFGHVHKPLQTICGY